MKKFKSKLDPPSDDIVEETTRETMMKRKEVEGHMMKFKVTAFIVLVVLGFLALFVFKFMRFVNHTFFALLVLGCLIVFLWGWITRKRKK